MSLNLKPLVLFPALLIGLFLASSGFAQNITPRPTIIGPGDSVSLRITPTPIRRLNVDIQRIVDVHLEAVSDTRMVFSSTVGFDANKRFYIWDPDEAELIDSLEDGIPGSVVMPDDGRYMIFLHDETDSLRDVNGDNAHSIVMRMYHCKTGQRINLDIPARSATPMPGETRANFEIELKNNRLAYSKSDSSDNSQRDTDAAWHIMNLLDIVYEIEGTPTPVPTSTPVIVGTPTPTFTPSPVPTPTIYPTVPPEYRSNADINADGNVNQLDLLLFQYFWQK